MKTITKLLIAMACVCLLIACSKSDDQLTPNSNNDDQSMTLKKTTPPNYTDDGTGTYSHIIHIVDNTYEIPIFCNGVQVDNLKFPADYTLRAKEHFMNDVATWYRSVLNKVVYTSTITGEQFKAVDYESGSMDTTLFDWKMNLKGNQGNHYNIHMVFDLNTMDVVKIHSVCH
jgi:hypothetical protein